MAGAVPGGGQQKDSEHGFAEFIGFLDSHVPLAIVSKLASVGVGFFPSGKDFHGWWWWW
jgi:hypothetical protein